MDDKRRRARVQGAWAGPAKNSSRPASHPVQTSAKPQRWGSEQFTYEEPGEVNRRVPEPRIIEKEGTYDISSSPSGVSRLRLVPLFIDPKEADWMFEQLQSEIPWRQKTNLGPDGPYQEPRLTCWYGEVPYTYSRSTLQPNPHWHPLLTMLRDRTQEVTGRTFNSLLCNLYRHHKDSIDWHSDDEPDLGRNPVIASLSFGETRVFQMRKKPPPVLCNGVMIGNLSLCQSRTCRINHCMPVGIRIGTPWYHGRRPPGSCSVTAFHYVMTQEDHGDYTYVEHVHVPLDHGSLLLMEGATQEDWQHRVPKEYHDRRARINLTFRTMLPGGKK